MGAPPDGAVGIVTTKGDLLAVLANGDVERQAIGVDDTFLVADPSSPTGFVWRKLTPADHTTKFNWYGITANSETDDGAYATVEVGQNASINMTFHFPEDFATLDLVEVWCYSASTVVDKSIELFSNYAAEGETKFANAESDVAQLFDFTADVIKKIDVTSLFTNPAAGDVAGVMLDHKGINTSIRYLGLHQHYKPG